MVEHDGGFYVCAGLFVLACLLSFDGRMDGRARRPGPRSGYFSFLAERSARPVPVAPSPWSRPRGVVCGVWCVVCGVWCVVCVVCVVCVCVCEREKYQV